MSLDRLMDEGNFEEALILCRAEITQYSIWHQQHTVPWLRSPDSDAETLLNVDIGAMAALVHPLLWCYLKTGRAQDLPTVLERLRRNIADERWQRKIVYFQALCACGLDWDMAAGRRELSKILPMTDENDVETLQLYLDLFGEGVSFSERQDCIQRVLELSEKDSDRLQYRSFRACEYFQIGDINKAKDELTESIDAYRHNCAGKSVDAHTRHQFALALDLLGTFKGETALLDEALTILRELSQGNGWTPSGLAMLQRNIGEVLGRMGQWGRAAEAYEKSLGLEPSGLAQVFLSRCHLELGEERQAQQAIARVELNSLDAPGRLDHAVVFSAIALSLGEIAMLEEAEALLRSAESKCPLFREDRDQLLLRIRESLLSGKSGPLSVGAKGGLRSLVRMISRYVVLRPNFMGIGLHGNRIIEDWARTDENPRDT